MTRYVALVCRLSPRPDGSYEGVDLQERWGRDYAAVAWPGVPIEVFADKGISGESDDRPGFERFREWLADGRIVHVWASEQTRLERREVEWFRLAGELVAAGIGEVHTKRDGIVRVQDAVAGIKAVLAADELRKIKKRVNDRLAENAADGLPPGSRPFGYAHGVTAQGVKTYVVIEEQAEAIRWAAERVLSGWALGNIAAALRERGVHGAHRVKVRDGDGRVVTEDGTPVEDGGRAVTRPSTITDASVRSWLSSPTVAGFRVHDKRIVGRGNWPPILDEETWQACRLRMSLPRTVLRSDGGTYPVTEAHKGNPTGRRYLLTGGLAVCGVCLAPMVASVMKRKGQSKPYYLCHPNKRRPNGEPAGACVGILGLELEQHVVDQLFAELDKPAFLEAIAVDEYAGRRDEITTALQGIEGQRASLAELWATPGELTDAEWRTARRALAENEQRLLRELAEVPRPAQHVDIAGARAAWPSMPLDEKREFLRLYIAQVTVYRAKPGTRGFDTDRVGIDWAWV